MRILRGETASDQRRVGLTLVEVMLSLAIFVGSMAALGQLIANGVRGAVQARLQTQAILRCESTLAEVVAGVRPFQSSSGLFLDDPTWSWTVSIVSGPHIELFIVQATASHAASNNVGNVSYSLQRLVRDPQVFLDAMAAEEAAAAAAEGTGT